MITYFGVWMIHTYQKFWNRSSRSPQLAATTQPWWLLGNPLAQLRRSKSRPVSVQEKSLKSHERWFLAGRRQWGVYLDELPAGFSFQIHGWLFKWLTIKLRPQLWQLTSWHFRARLLLELDLCFWWQRIIFSLWESFQYCCHTQTTSVCQR